MSVDEDIALVRHMLQEVLTFWAICASGLVVEFLFLIQFGSGSGSMFTADILLLSVAATFLSGIFAALYVNYRPLWGDA